MNFHCIDVRDDGGQLLRERIPFDKLPDFVKTANLLAEGLEAHDYAVVIDDGSGIYPKFPRHDPGSIAVSGFYLRHHAEELPDEVVKTAAMNLAAAASGFNMEIPEFLLKLAGIPSKPERIADRAPYVKVAAGPKVTTTAGKIRERIGRARVKADSVPRGGHTGTKLKTSAPVSGQMRRDAPTGQPFIPTKFGRVGGLKPSEQPATAILTRGFTPPKLMGKTKRGGVAPYETTVAAARHFDEEWKRMHPGERIKLAQALVPQCNALGIPTSTIAQVYAFGVLDREMAKVAFAMRERLNGERGVYAELEKYADNADATTLITMLWEADEATGLSRYWDSKIPDPFLSCMVKQAAHDESFTVGDEYCSAEDLRRLATDQADLVRDQFTDDFAEQFERDPTTIFESLPLDTKKVLLQMAKQGHVEKSARERR